MYIRIGWLVETVATKKMKLCAATASQFRIETKFNSNRNYELIVRLRNVRNHWLEFVVQLKPGTNFFVFLHSNPVCECWTFQREIPQTTIWICLFTDSSGMQVTKRWTAANTHSHLSRTVPFLGSSIVHCMTLPNINHWTFCLSFHFRLNALEARILFYNYFFFLRSVAVRIWVFTVALGILTSNALFSTTIYCHKRILTKKNESLVADETAAHIGNWFLLCYERQWYILAHYFLVLRARLGSAFKPWYFLY